MATIAGIDARRFWTVWLAAPLGCVLLALAAVRGFEWDSALGAALYRWQGGSWALKEQPLLAHWLHTVARNLSLTLWLAVVAAWLWARWLAPAAAAPWPAAGRNGMAARLVRHRRELGYLALVVGLAALSISVLKRASAIHCPWDLAEFGGRMPHLGIWEGFFGGFRPKGHCFPAGHASSAYAWLALPLALRSAGAGRAGVRAALLVVLAAGLLLGGVQQLRGAHLLSHDLFTLGCCWLVACVGAALGLRGSAAGRGVLAAGSSAPPQTDAALTGAARRPTR